MGAVNSSKKGIFFTFIAITIMAVFLLVFTPQADISLQRNAQAITARIGAIDNYVSALENDYFEAVLRASAHKAILSLIYYINSTGSYIPNFDASFSEVMRTGDINGVAIDFITGKKIMENNTLLNWSSRIAIAAKEALNVNTTIAINNVSISQKDPWTVEPILSFNMTISSNVASWNKTNVKVKAPVNIGGLYDPYYFVNSNRAYSNQIKMSSVELGQWNSSKARWHLRNGAYTHWQDSGSPTFLMRFTNDFSDGAQKECCGIESLVNPNKVSPSSQTESYVDFLFWSHSYNDCKKLYNVNVFSDDFPGFKLEIDHLTKYNITDTEASPSC